MEVAHDIQQSVSKYVTSRLNLINSFDTWHGNVITIIHVRIFVSYNCISGTKNVGKEMKKITEGRARDRGKTWFPQLVDKSMFSTN